MLVRHLTVAVLLSGAAGAVVANPPADPSPPAPTEAPADSAEALLAEIKAIKPRAVDASRQADPEYRREYAEAMQALARKQLDLRLRFVRTYPTHPEASAFAAGVVRMAGQFQQPVEPLVDELLALPLTREAKVAIRLQAIQTSLSQGGGDPEAAQAKLDALKQEQPDHPGLPAIALLIARGSKGDVGIERLRAVVADYPDSPPARTAAGLLRALDGVGQPFELAFDDAVTGRRIDLQNDLKGKIVVIDFWATWCGPCIAEMPKMKSLYAQFKSQGVEFIGVSLDQPEDKGGKQKLLDYVAKNDIAWPQYYQGNYWQSEFSSSWGINSIPALFVVDADGKLASTKARGQLETLLPELIARRDGK